MKGIYKITQKSTGKVYIGQSMHIFVRWEQHIQAIDNLSFHQAWQQNPLDFTFEVVEQNDNYTKEDLDRLEKYYITQCKSNDPQYGFNGTAGNGSYKPLKPIRMLYVSGSINRIIHRHYLKTAENKKILIIGNFKFCDTLSLYNDVTIITDDYDFTCEDAKVIKISTGEELMGEMNKIQKDQFDLIIANPPYNIGNKIVSKFVDKAKESIVLMPISCYKGQNLYKHILTLTLADPKSFTDAQITNNLCVCKLIDKEINQTFDEIELQTFNQEYREFYELNRNIKPQFGLELKLTDIDNVDVNTWFLITFRTVQNGVHKTTKCLDYPFNVNFDNSQPLPYDKYLNSYSPRFLIFQDRHQKENFNQFWYKNPLMNSFIKGLNKSQGYMFDAIPNIDYSIDRDYEHLTYDELLSIMREELKKQGGAK